MLTKFPQLNSDKNFVKERLSTIRKITHNLLRKKCQNPATFVEGFWPEFPARGRFMKYSMSEQNRVWNCKCQGKEDPRHGAEDHCVLQCFCLQ